MGKGVGVRREFFNDKKRCRKSDVSSIVRFRRQTFSLKKSIRNLSANPSSESWKPRNRDWCWRNNVTITWSLTPLFEKKKNSRQCCYLFTVILEGFEWTRSFGAFKTTAAIVPGHSHKTTRQFLRNIWTTERPSPDYTILDVLSFGTGT